MSPDREGEHEQRHQLTKEEQVHVLGADRGAQHGPDQDADQGHPRTSPALAEEGRKQDDADRADGVRPAALDRLERHPDLEQADGADQGRDTDVDHPLTPALTLHGLNLGAHAPPRHHP
ncbi:hypothetical protein [Ornithinimicrobium ciconiae]|uniref:hypothetical protein n=1 Tax=Ornithinimicrobium ciconiae TaxID=2594265 RepID=UPI0013FCF849|nr:hypothetical protein [Ornithinimicrobium ciconiae]